MKSKKIFTISAAVVLALLLARFTVFALAQNGALQPKSDTLKGKTVFLDAGHGKGSGGAYALYKEHRHMLLYANAVKACLERSGATVVMTRNTAEDVDNYARSAMINARTMGILLAFEEAERESLAAELALQPTNTLPDNDIAKTQALLEQKDNTVAELKELIAAMESVIEQPKLAGKYFLCPYSTANGRPVSPELERIFEYQKDERLKDVIFISLHSNATGDLNARTHGTNGTVAYYMDNAMNTAYYTGYQEEKNALLSRLLLSYVAAGGNFKEKALLVNDFYMVRETNIPSALVEIAFHTNTGDRLKLTSPLTRLQVARGVVRAVREYFNVVE